MAYLDKRRKQIHYRHAVLLPNHSKLGLQTLQQRFSRLMSQELTNITDRLYFQSGDSIEKDPHMAFSHCFEEKGMFCGQIVYVEPGNSVPVISKNDYNKASLPVEALQISDEMSREYLDSIAFISIINNHVIILQSKAIRIKDIEEYLNFLLQSNKEIDDYEFVTLQANNLTLDDNTLKNKQVKNVNITLPLSVNPSHLDDTVAFDVLSSLLGSHRIEELKSLQTTDTKDLKIDINIGYKYNTNDANQNMLTKLTQDLLDNRDESLTIELKGTGRLVGDEIQLKTTINLPYDKSLPVTEHVFRLMLDWLLELLDQGVINP
ncbi:hypothetical protein [Aliivibrio sp. S10_S31]|uniref:hypothetical protein n=1 Tax=Aliivibrio sp. S10_S31 TaxID=2720224 RepID=UPI0016805944|nr:hypothetical protein [Aliivibrio sp. S10_S31]MBD1571500.1 hypothetical protein [Aliivibrio sp. S10_S31]